MREYKQVLRVEGLRTSYRKKEILHGVSLDMSEGEIVGVIGSNGAGKSTLLNSIFGLVGFKGGTVKGEIIFNGVDVTHLTPSKKVQSGIGYVLQGGEIFSNLSVEDNLDLAFQPSNNGALGKQRESIYAMFPMLYHYRKKRAGLLSGGQRQMLAIGSMLMTRPKLLLMDEPTASLSLEAAEAISEAIAKLREDLHLAILLVEQNIDRCLSLSDRVYLMREGRIVDADTSSNIVKQNKLERLFEFRNGFQNN